MGRTLLALALFAAAAHAGQTVYQQDCDVPDAATILDTAVQGAEMVPAEKGGNFLKLAEDVHAAALKAFPAAPETKYRFSFLGRIEDENTVEKNDRAHIEMLRTYGRFAPAYAILFLDAHGNQIESKFHGCSGAVLTSDWYRYVYVFYSPAGTRSMKIEFLPRKRPFHADDLEVTVESEEGAVNCNTDFSYGELNYCGWRPARDGRLYKRPDGEIVLKSGYGGGSTYFPLHEGKNYRVYVRGQGQVPGGSVRMNYYDEEVNRLGQRFLLRPTPDGGHVDLAPPPKTRYGSVVMYSVILQELKVTALPPGSE